MPQCGMQVDTAMRLVAVQVKRHGQYGEMDHGDRDDDVSGQAEIQESIEIIHATSVPG